MAGKVLNSYPDYAKATPGYTAGIVEAFARYSPEVQEKLADLTRGLRSRCDFLPTISAVVKMAEEIEAELFRKSELDRKYAGKRVIEPITTVIYCPFPQLEKEFGRDALLQATFEKLDEACRVLVLYGRAAAEEVLKDRKRKRAA